MSARGRTSRWLATGVAALLLGGCGTVEEERRSDRDVAERALLRASDLPSGWTRSPASGEDLPSDAELAELCPDYPADHVSADADGQVTFEDAGGLAVVQSVSLLDDDAGAKEAVEDLPSERAQRCTEAIMLDTMRSEPAAEQIEFGDLRMVPIDTAGLGANTRGVRMRLQMTMQGVTVVMRADMLASHTGNAVTCVTTMAVEGRFDPRLRDELNARAAERLRAALVDR
ncbi:hypothetical protein [Conexibacter woesei]|uniref:Lipoprotein n=1 Tax=Conexibacter woesei (strain DSM 14684 / CCUG 47730 / CIP 108061 / JCM 11494 / NBRC 100937 / ID131577) TaxID=469383 RepID=D3EZX1_CONWI|nr:hypothetical protein [Conexibacter woesei]ADB49947.1 hypothetical protein Cwoe_1519 [Conexibacter woesei DSM 14684]